MAGVLLTDALRAWQQLRGRAGMAFALAGPGELAADGGQPHRAGQLLGAAQAMLPATHPLLRVIVPYDLPGRLAVARRGGDPAAFDRGLAEGQGWRSTGQSPQVWPARPTRTSASSSCRSVGPQQALNEPIACLMPSAGNSSRASVICRPVASACLLHQRCGLGDLSAE
jgi:hypothetical protein